EIQLAVDEIVFKTHSKYTIIKKTMKQTIDPTQAPEWFLAFQKQVLTFQEFTVQQFKKQEQFNKRQEEFNKRQEQFNKQIESEIKNIHVQIDNMDKHQPTWFTQWVQTDFKPLQARIDNLIKINNLKE
ncbi:MAG: hypothetical protein LBD63_01550, partial [Mycoplasmataceae bacterium]|nr:hypothetical protein [Mycoplasmataceae bacterium]